MGSIAHRPLDPHGRTQASRHTAIGALAVLLLPATLGCGQQADADIAADGAPLTTSVTDDGTAELELVVNEEAGSLSLAATLHNLGEQPLLTRAGCDDIRFTVVPTADIVDAVSALPDDVESDLVESALHAHPQIDCHGGEPIPAGGSTTWAATWDGDLLDEPTSAAAVDVQVHLSTGDIASGGVTLEATLDLPADDTATSSDPLVEALTALADEAEVDSFLVDRQFLDARLDRDGDQFILTVFADSSTGAESLVVTTSAAGSPPARTIETNPSPETSP
ncbi:MAG: hypothetical protein JJU45_13475 [Acidimicrobiia bacterium]|nr:hypothetical protein [Acidimicrobiia bacterium]